MKKKFLTRSRNKKTIIEEKVIVLDETENGSLLDGQTKEGYDNDETGRYVVTKEILEDVNKDFVKKDGSNLEEDDVKALRDVLKIKEINPEELGKVDTVDGVKPDKNKNVNLNALVKNKVNEVGEEFALKKGNTTLSFDEEQIVFNTDYADIYIGSDDGYAISCSFKDGSYFGANSKTISGEADGYLWVVASQNGFSNLLLPITGEDREHQSKTLAASWNGVFADEYGDIKTSAYIEITYQELVDKRNKGELSPGMYYRITDYVTKTNSEGGWYRSAEHPFDIIVQAITNKTLDHNARADFREGDEYFLGVSDLSKWELKYDLDNNTDRYEWADAENGKGVIYFMKDENNNELPYDFKSIQFKVYKCSDVVLYIQNVDAEDNSLEDHKSLIGQYCVMNNNLGLAQEMLIRDINDFKFLYTFHLLDEETLNEFESDVKGVKNLEASNNPIVKNSIINNKIDYSLRSYMRDDGLIGVKQSLNNNVFHLQGEDYYFGVNMNNLTSTSDNFFRGGFIGNTFNSVFRRNYVGPFFTRNTVNGELHTSVFELEIMHNGCTQNVFDVSEMNLVYINSNSFSGNVIKGKFTRNAIISAFSYNNTGGELTGCLIRGTFSYNDVLSMNSSKVYSQISSNKINSINSMKFCNLVSLSTFSELSNCVLNAVMFRCVFTRVLLSSFKSNSDIEDGVFSGALNLNLDLGNLKTKIEFNGNGKDLKNKDFVSEFSKFSVTPAKISIMPAADSNTFIMSGKISANNTEEFDVTIS